MDCENETETAVDTGKVLEIAMEAGHILLENGAEIYRVEETMRRIASSFGVEHDDFFVLSNGIFTTGGNPSDRKQGVFAKVEHIPVKGTQLERVVMVNQLSREIEAGKYTLDEVAVKLSEIRNSKGKPMWAQILASGIGSGAFCILFGGNLLDASAACFVGLVLWFFVLMVSAKYLGKILGNILGGALVTILCILCQSIGFGDNLNHMIIGAIIPLIPGVPFTNGIRDIADGDYISGAVRLLDAALVFLSIAIGVGIVFSIYGRGFGGVLL